jgi:hypothetical protein
MFNLDRRESHILEGIIFGALFALAARALLHLIWACRYIILIFVAGWFIQYHVSGDAKRDQIVEKYFDETAAVMERFHFEIGRDRHGDATAIAAPIVTNNTGATLTSFLTQCTFYLRGQFAHDRTETFSVKYPFVPLRPGETREVALDISDAKDYLLRQMDPETLRCRIMVRRFDKREMYLAALAKANRN